MKIQLLSTWKMSHEAMKKTWPRIQEYKALHSQQSTCNCKALGDLVEAVIRDVEDDTSLRSVGSGALPGKTGILELDAAYMEATGLKVGAVMALRSVKNPITLARYVSHRDRNCILASRGAEALASELHMEVLPPLTPQARTMWEKASQEQGEQSAYEEQAKTQAACAQPSPGSAMDDNVQPSRRFPQTTQPMPNPSTAKEEPQRNSLSACRHPHACEETLDSSSDPVDNTHDTVCVLGRWEEELIVGVSTSGLFMKEEGRVGDSPLIGSGFYARKGVGAASATGLGEDILRGCLSYEVVRQMEEGLSPQKACEKALLSLEKLLDGKKTSIAVLALGAEGEIGAAATMAVFPFVYMDEAIHPKLMTVRREGPRFYVGEADQDFYDNYTGD